MTNSKGDTWFVHKSAFKSVPSTQDHWLARAPSEALVVQIRVKAGGETKSCLGLYFARRSSTAQSNVTYWDVGAVIPTLAVVRGSLGIDVNWRWADIQPDLSFRLKVGSA